MGNFGCPEGCSYAGNLTQGALCYDLLATAEDIAAETNLCTPMYYKSATNDCPTGCSDVYFPIADPSNACIQPFSDPSGSYTFTEGFDWDGGRNVSSDSTPTLGRPDLLCTGPVSPKRVCFPTRRRDNGLFGRQRKSVPLVDEADTTRQRRDGHGVGLDFTSKVISRITKKGFWERHCQDVCYEREACGAYVYTRGTCKLYADLEIDQAQLDAYRADSFNLREIHNVKTVKDANGDWDLSKWVFPADGETQRDRRITGVCGDPNIIRNVIQFGGF